MAMNCEEVQQQIEFYVLGDLTGMERREIEIHLKTCSRCRAIEAQYLQLMDELRQSSQTAPPNAEFERNVLRSVEREIRSVAPRARVSRTAAYAAGLAACLFISLAIWQLWVHREADTKPASIKSSAAPLANIHSYSIPAYAISVPTSIADDMVVREHDIYLLCQDSPRANVAALDSRTGVQKWRSEIESYGFLTADETRVCCLAPGDSGRVDLVAIDAADGRTVWRYSQEKPNILPGLCAPALSPEGRICWAVNTTIHMLRSSDGKVLWTHEIPGEGLLSTPVAVGNGLYVAGTAGLYYLDIASGEQLWRAEYDFDVSHWVRPLLAVAQGQICVALRTVTGRSRLVHINSADRKAMWTKTVPQVSHLCIAGNRLYVRSQGVKALDMDNGKLLWSFASTGCSPVTCANSLVWFVDSSEQGRLIALDEHTGRTELDLTGIHSCNAFIELGDRGYVKTHDGSVRVILFEG